LEEITRSRQLPHSLVQRAKVVLLAAAGKNNKTISQELKQQEETVGIWRKRWLLASGELAACKGKPKALWNAIESILADAPRPGIAPIFTPEQICQIIALACETPPEHLSHWTRKTLAEEAIKRKIVETISPTTIGRFLKSGAAKTTSVVLLAES
jgi:transposase